MSESATLENMVRKGLRFIDGNSQVYLPTLIEQIRRLEKIEQMARLYVQGYEHRLNDLAEAINEYDVLLPNPYASGAPTPPPPEITLTPNRDCSDC